MGLAPIELKDVAGGTGGFVIHGREAGDQAGAVVAAAGDIDGDGFDDLIIGARGGDGAGNLAEDAGEAYVLFGQASRPATPIQLAAVAAGSGGFVLYGQDAADRAGGAVAAAGDVDGDGFADLLIGARYADGAGNAENRAGETYVLFGQAGSFAAAVNLADVAGGTGGFVLFGADPGDYSGSSVASAGDINGDGFDDLIIGAPLADPDGTARYNTGETHVVFGRAASFGAGVDLAAIASGSLGFVIRGEDPEDRSGRSVASAGDIDGDGLDDLLIGAWRGDGAANARDLAGDSYVLFGRTAGFGAIVELADVAAGTGGFSIHGRDPFDYSGISVSAAGDINGDGFTDMLIGASGGDARGYASDDAGETYVVFGRAGGFTAGVNLVNIANGVGGFVINGQDATDRSAFSATAAGDVNGDGFDDLIIGAYGVDPAGRNDAGAAYVVFGKASGFTAVVDLATIAAGTGGFIIRGDKPGDHAGISVAAAGDVDGDGFGDLVIGTRYADAAGKFNASTGDSYVVFGRDFGLAVTHPGSPAGDILSGSAVADTMVGGQGGDFLAGGGGADVLNGGAGDDTLRITDLDFRRVDGGSGNDTLIVDAASLVLDLNAIADARLTEIEHFDLGTGATNTLRLSAREVLNLSTTTDTITVDGDAGSTLSLGDGSWTAGATGGGYRSYTGGQATVLANLNLGSVLSRRVSVAATLADQPEGDGGTTTFTFTVTRGGDTSEADTVEYAVTGTGPRPANAADFQGAATPSGSVGFAPGATTAIVTIDVAGDTTIEGHEGFAVTLSAPSKGVELVTNTAIGRIAADDAITDLIVIDGTTGLPIAAEPTFYEGPVAVLEKEFIRITAENLVISANGNWFLHSGSGDDAIAVSSGTNVLDGGTGSNFLTGAGGADTFFVDARGATALIWSTVNEFGAGDAATLWGVSSSNFSIDWVDDEGAVGFTGLTLHATAPGVPEARLTLVGYSSADLTSGALSLLFAHDDASNSDFLFIQAT